MFRRLAQGRELGFCWRQMHRLRAPLRRLQTTAYHRDSYHCAQDEQQTAQAFATGFQYRFHRHGGMRSNQNV